jgi:toxin ParE1/3/4
MSLRLLPEARDDIANAALWYDEQVDGLGDVFADEVERCLERIEAGPLRYPVTYKSLRRAITHKFPYSVYFRNRGDDVAVLAVLHQSRDRKLLDDRISLP